MGDDKPPPSDANPKVVVAFKKNRSQPFESFVFT